MRTREPVAAGPSGSRTWGPASAGPQTRWVDVGAGFSRPASHGPLIIETRHAAVTLRNAATLSSEKRAAPVRRYAYRAAYVCGVR